MKRVLLFILLTIVFTSSLEAQTKFTASNNVKAELKRVQNLYFKRDFNNGSELAKKLIEKYPDSVVLKAWYVLNLARGDNNKLSLTYAENLVKQYGENEWTLLALTTAQSFHKRQKSLESGEKLIKIAPTNEEAILTYSFALYQNGKDKEAVEWLEKSKNNVRDKVRFLTQLAMSTYYDEKKKDKGDTKKAFDLFAQAVKINPLSVNANYFYGTYLTYVNRFDEALPYLKKAASLSPLGSNITEKYWQAIESQTNKTDEQKKAGLERAITQHLTNTKNSPEALLAAWSKYQDLTGWKEAAKSEDVKKRDYFEKQILDKYPNTKFDEAILYTQIRSAYAKYFSKEDEIKWREILFKRKSKRTPEEAKFFEKYQEKNEILEAEQIALRRAYLKRPKHFNKDYLGNVYLNQFYQLANQKETTEQELGDLLKGSSENNKNYLGNLNSYIASVLLIRQKMQPDSVLAKDAEKYARRGLEEAENKVKELSKDAKADQIYEIKLSPTNILANVLLTNENLDDAEKFLLKASQMKVEDNPRSLEYDHNFTEELWAKFYTAKKNWAKAEGLYLKTAGDDEDATRETFEKFYEKKTGKKDGFTEYFAEIQNKLKVVAKEKVTQTRIKNAKEIIPFTLKTLDGKPFYSDELKGKVVVINIWGVWCGPCVAEMPELQKLHEKYKDDKDVAVLTLDTGDKLETVKKLIAEKKYTLPVLIDENYIDKLPQFENYLTYPTTLFIDKSGKVSFVVVGATTDLIENFSWRIDILKEDK